MSSLEAGAQGVAIHQGAPVERCCQPLQCQGLLLRSRGQLGPAGAACISMRVPLLLIVLW